MDSYEHIFQHVGQSYNWIVGAIERVIQFRTLIILYLIIPIPIITPSAIAMATALFQAERGIFIECHHFVGSCIEDKIYSLKTLCIPVGYKYIFWIVFGD